MDPNELNEGPATAAEPGGGAPASPGGMAPGDEAPAGTKGTGEDLCPECGGSGRANGRDCPSCAGTGTVVKGISGA